MGLDMFAWRVKAEDIVDDLTIRREEDGRNGALPHTEGFFFGNNPPDDESLKEDLQFIQKARDAIAEGDAVYYDSWW